jgi:branched-chain amino acid aminotransferase
MYIIKVIMIETMEFPVQYTNVSKLNNLSLTNIPFGKYYTDYMLEADYIDGNWTNITIKPYQPLQLDPSTAALHYGQAIFEGIKAYANPSGQIAIFRPYENFKRFNISAKRMHMPAVPEHIFIDGMKQLVNLEKNWVPTADDHSLYLRPFMFSSDPLIGVRPSDNYKFMIICSPTGPYYTAPMRIYVEENYVRAVPGGVGYAKAAGNYAASMMVTAQAKQKGYDQVLWTDAFEHKYVQEIGTMNVFFVLNNKVITPALNQGTILEGVTRNSVITLLKHMNIEVEETQISIDDIVNYYNNGQLKEVFGTGTAATISLIKELKYKETIMEFDANAFTVAPKIKSTLTAIREGKQADDYNWMEPVN